MKSRLGVAYTCCHSDPEYSNERFTWLGNFIYDLKPDFVIDLGDIAEMASLSGFDNAKPEVIVSKNYERDIATNGDAQERLRHKFIRNKKRKPYWVGMQGNHEYRINKALIANPRIYGDDYGLSPKHLEPDHWYDEYHPYQNGAPAVAQFEGINLAHYIASGNYGTAMSGEHHAYNLLKKMMRSTIVGHSHKLNVYWRPDAKAIGAVIGCYKGGETSWAGQANNEWWKGVMVMHNTEDGWFDPQFVSQESLKRDYS